VKVIVAGGREFNNYNLLVDSLDKAFQKLNKNKLIIVSGGAKGADALGEKYAKDRGYPLEIFPADWQLHGKAAGPIRNKQMAENADALVAFDSGGPGTRNMIKTAKELNLKVRVVDARG
jgi:predicted Rossmann-fold nucleotide-binding protein